MSIDFKQVDFFYQYQTPFEHQALFEISANIKPGNYTAIIGSTGSGKSTFIQQIDALLKPTKGCVVVNGFKIDKNTKEKNLNELRKKIGIVFQFPEQQLFEETVFKDVAFGPENFSQKHENINHKVEKALKLVNISKDLWQRSPFELSGGQMRRVAIAGILAMEPEVLILDEPTAGLDPRGQREIMTLFNEIHQQGTTMILVTHKMDLVAEYVDEVIVMEKGTIIKIGSPTTIFSDKKWLLDHHMLAPKATEFAFKLKDKGLKFNTLPITVNELVSEISNLYH